MLPVFILACVFCTSLISGVLGMAGGIILMAILVSLLSVSATMVVHGLVQATANGSRAFFLRAHIQWRILPMYILGACIASGFFISVTLVPNANMILICIGLFPWVSRILPALKGLNIMHRNTTVLCGIVVTSAQLFAGASGPLLDIFYLNASLSRQQIIATKAITQTLGHLLKLLYYTMVVQLSGTLPLWLMVLAMCSAILGTRLGTHLVKHFSDSQFRRFSSYAILCIGSLCLIKGVMGELA